MRCINRKKIYISFLAFIALFVFFPISAYAQENDQKPMLFVEEGCPHCRNVEEFLVNNSLETEVEIFDTRANPENAALYTEKVSQAGIPIQEQGVPTLFNGDEYRIGDTPIINYLSDMFGIAIEDTPDDSPNNVVVLGILGGGVLVSVVFLFITRKKSS